MLAGADPVHPPNPNTQPPPPVFETVEGIIFCEKVALAADKLPEIFAVPVMFAPVPVTTNVVLPTAVILTLPLILLLLVIQQQ